MGMQAGPLTRTRKSQKKYKEHLAIPSEGCDFCKFELGIDPVIKEFKHSWLVNNIYGYDFWDGVEVAEHLLLLPKRHHTKLDEFSESESKELMRLLAQYEQEGYSVYWRAPQNITRSVAHHHIHLIKLKDKRKKALIFIHKPHIVLYY